ncbi:hypothetical protein [Ruminiclostridium cellobioparum]|jgi:hypothetical protein|uniref:hypothetical protein n=1 Tax=Ruminiclostridium cellobioparum TaxID=29355 RepID=UPI0028ABBBC0|nr:hypothetical protein [Ruminiclostridium cellobioparum]
MIVTKKYIRELREKTFLKISEETEKIILEKLGKEPEADEDGCRHTYTDQDIWEQIRKIIRDNN